VLWRGVWRPAVGEVVGAGARAAALAEYRRTFPRTPDGALVICIAVRGSGPAVFRERSLLGRWTRWVTLGETVGFAVPAVSWIAVTAAGWLAGLAVFLVVAMPLWHEGQPLWQTVAFGTFAGLLMATTAAVVTGLGLVRLLRRHDVRAAASEPQPSRTMR